MCLKAVRVRGRRTSCGSRLRIPTVPGDYIKSVWFRQEPTIYGRFDFAYDGNRPPKLLEYNADTPTALLEAAVVQWFWLKDVEARRPTSSIRSTSG